MGSDRGRRKRLSRDALTSGLNEELAKRRKTEAVTPPESSNKKVDVPASSAVPVSAPAEGLSIESQQLGSTDVPEAEAPIQAPQPSSIEAAPIAEEVPVLLPSSEKEQQSAEAAERSPSPETVANRFLTEPQNQEASTSGTPNVEMTEGQNKESDLSPIGRSFHSIDSATMGLLPTIQVPDSVRALFLEQQTVAEVCFGDVANLPDAERGRIWSRKATAGAGVPPTSIVSPHLKAQLLMMEVIFLRPWPVLFYTLCFPCFCFLYILTDLLLFASVIRPYKISQLRLRCMNCFRALCKPEKMS